MANMENMQSHVINLTPESILRNDFEKTGKELSKPLCYKDSDGEEVLIAKEDDGISIYKAQDPDKPMKLLPAQNLKSKYALIKNSDGSFSLETKTYKNVGAFQAKLNQQKVKLGVDAARISLTKITKRIDEARAFKQQRAREKFKDMQQYAYNHEVQDKTEADNLINNLDDSQLA